MLKKGLLCVLSVLFITGCVATGPKFTRESLAELTGNQSQIFIMRQSQFMEGGTYPLVFVDGKEAGELMNGSYLVVNTAPGEHEVVVESGGLLRGQWIHPQRKKTVSMGPGTRRYFEVTLTTKGVVNNIILRGSGIVEHNEKSALNILAELSLSEQPSGEKVELND